MKVNPLTISSFYFLIFSQLLFQGSVWAGGPLSLVNNAAVVYSNGGRGIVLNFDQGLLGTRNNNSADSAALNAINLWNSVSTATISLSQGSDIPVDVDSTNFSTYINGTGSSSDGINPFIYDSDGGVIDALLGAGQSSSILGIAGSSFFISGPNAGKYTEGYLVLNGSRNISDTRLIVTMAHELGHFFGVDHSQLDTDQGLSSGNTVLMYPSSIRSTTTLHEDDIQTVSQLYPETNNNLSYATINGNFQNSNGSAKLGANVWIEETTTGKVYSSVSDYLDVGNGEFKMLVPAGTYTLQAEAIQSSFFGGSSVGPHAENSSDLSFVNPISKVDYQANNISPFQFIIVTGCEINVTFRSDGTGTNDSCNIPPIANNGNLNVTEDITSISILTGATSNSGVLTFAIASNASKGTITITNTSTGAYSYVPNSNATGADTFTFNTIENGTTTSLIATISVNIANINDAPVATNSNLSLIENTNINANVSANDIDNDTLNYSISISPTIGTVTLNSQTGAFTYTSTGGNGADSFSYLVSDGNGGSDTGTVTLTISPIDNGSTTPILDPVPEPVTQPPVVEAPVTNGGGGGLSWLMFLLLIPIVMTRASLRLYFCH